MVAAAELGGARLEDLGTLSNSPEAGGGGDIEPGEGRGWEGKLSFP